MDSKRDIRGTRAICEGAREAPQNSKNFGRLSYSADGDLKPTQPRVISVIPFLIPVPSRQGQASLLLTALIRKQQERGLIAIEGYEPRAGYHHSH